MVPENTKDDEDVADVVKQHRFFRRYSEERESGVCWYYEAREGVFGPFPSREAAEQDLAQLMYANPWRRTEHKEHPAEPKESSSQEE